MYNAWGVLRGKHTSHAHMHLATVAMYSSPTLLVTVVKRITRLLTLTRGCPRHAWVLRMAWHLAITAWSQHAAQLRTTTRSCAMNDMRARRNWNTQCPCSRSNRGDNRCASKRRTWKHPSESRGTAARWSVQITSHNVMHAAHMRCQMDGAMRAHAHTHQCQDHSSHAHTHTLTHVRRVA